MAGPLGITIEVTGLNQVRDVMARILLASEPSLILDQAAALQLNRIRTRFLAEEDPDGQPWVPSVSGAKRKAAGDGMTLFDTGNLFRSIHAFSNSPEERAIGTDVEYGRIHQFGLEGNVARPFLGFSPEDVNLIELLVTRRIQEAIDR